MDVESNNVKCTKRQLTQRPKIEFYSIKKLKVNASKTTLNTKGFY